MDDEFKIIEETDENDNMKSKKHKKKRKKLSKKAKIILVVILLIIIGALALVLLMQDNNDAKTKEPEKKKKEVKQEEKQVQIVDLSSNSRPYAVMINNNKAVWGYQAGLQDAYITYEMIVEGGITRMMALFRDKDTARIASVRSSRHYYLDYVMENDAIYAHIGWSPQAQSDIRSYDIDIINADNSSAFTWDSALRNIAKEHRAYTSIAKLKEVAAKKGYRTTTEEDLLLKYQAEPLDLASIDGAIPANTVRIPYSSGHLTSYGYDAENKVYKRYQNHTEHKDYVTGLQYTAKNIITYKVHNYRLNDGYSGGRQGLNNVGSGEGYYISEGYAIPITWQKTSRSSKTIYKVKATGEELVVNDGNTYIQIQPDSQTLTIE